MDGADVTLAQWAGRWLATATLGINHRTRGNYERHFRFRILPALGQMPLTSLRRGMIRAFLLRLYESGCGRSLVRNTWIALAACLTAAVEQELLPSNPAHGAVRRLFPRQDPDGESRTIGRMDAVAALRAVDAYAPDIADIIWVAAETGLRIGEVLALKPGCIDFEKRLLHVREQFTQGTFDRPKGGRERAVDLSTHLVDRLAARLARLPAGAVYLFQSPRRRSPRPLGPSYVRAQFYLALERAHLPKITPHRWRHQAACMLLEETGDLFYVSKMLGHADVSITAGLYGRGAKPRRLQAVDRTAAALHGERLPPRSLRVVRPRARRA